MTTALTERQNELVFISARKNTSLSGHLHFSCIYVLFKTNPVISLEIIVSFFLFFLFLSSLVYPTY